MAYFQSQNPWLEAAQYGRELGNTLSQAFIQGPRLRAENEIALSRAPMERMLQQSQLDSAASDRMFRQAQLERQPLIDAGIRSEIEARNTQTDLHKSNLQQDKENRERLRIFQMMHATPQGEFTNYVEQNPPPGLMGASPEMQYDQGMALGVPMTYLQNPIAQMQEKMRTESQSPLEQARLDLIRQQTINAQNPLLRGETDKSPTVLNTYGNMVSGMMNANAGRPPKPGSDAYPIFTNALGNFNLMSDRVLRRYKQPVADAQGAVRMISPDGRAIRVPLAELEQAITEGYELNQ